MVKGTQRLFTPVLRTLRMIEDVRGGGECGGGLEYSFGGGMETIVHLEKGEDNVVGLRLGMSKQLHAQRNVGELT